MALGVLIVHQHLAFAEALQAIVNAQPDMQSFGVATSADALGLAVERRSPDVTLIDLDMIRESAGGTNRLPGGRRVATSSVVDLGAFEAAKVLGAAGFVGRHAPMSDVLAALRNPSTVMSVGGATLELLLTAARGGIDLSERQLRRAAGHVNLTRREREVLELMREGLDARSIAEVLHVSVHTARSHIKRVLAKLGAHSQLEAVAIVNRLASGPQERGSS